MVLTVLQEKLAEAHGLAIAASVVTAKVDAKIHDPLLREALDGMSRDADEVRARCLELERTYDEELAEELLAHANTTHEHAGNLVVNWFKAGTDPQRAWSFLAMGEAAEVTVWSALRTLAAKSANDAVRELAEWGEPVQLRHLELALEGAVRLAEPLDPAAPRFG
jgi:hypothetical protein